MPHPFHPIRRSAAVSGLWMAAAVSAPAAALAQDPGWHSAVEASATTRFGASEQTLASFATALSHLGEDFSADAHFKFFYGESKDADRITFVSSRSWAVAVSGEVHPKARWSPFFLGGVEASLEKRVARRVSGGAGAKLTLQTSGAGTASLSLALLGERVNALADTIAHAPSSMLRWSWRLKTEHRVAERVSFSHLTFYSPVFTTPGRYTVTSTSTGGFDLTKAVALTLSFVDNYDSEAIGRGALANNDGSFLFGVRGKF